jgi:hypothetical protein
VVDETSKSTIKEKKVLYNDVEKMIDSLVVGVKEVDSLLNK